ncbi:MAG: helix-turn-helix domain-containing protein [Nitrospirae bacterium]|nr:helix-turn-helix domain-containing protein [Nitrospirota bacterium]
MEFLTIQEVAKILKTHTNTVYKMCREGSLPCVKIGKEWRVDRAKFAQFMESGIRQKREEPFLGLVSDALKGGHVLGVFTEQDDIAEFELEFFKASPTAGWRFLKACWWQHPDDVRQYLAKGGFPVEKMEASGSFVMADLGKIFCSAGPVSAAEVWITATKDALGQGLKGLVGSGSPHFNCCGSHSALLEFEGALDKGLKGLPVAGVCSYFMDNDVPDGFSRFVDLVTDHDRFFVKTKDGGIFARNISSLASM